MEDRHLCLGNDIIDKHTGGNRLMCNDLSLAYIYSLKNMNKTISQCQATVAQACDALQPSSDAFHQDCGPGPLLHASCKL